jgi:osmotically-inducible protein OsmY
MSSIGVQWPGEMNHKRIFLPVALFFTFFATAFAAGKPVSDDFLVDTIRQKLAADQVVKGGAIDVTVKDGAVVLKGKVEEEKQKSKAEKIAKKVSGVKSVENDIQIAHP